MARLEYRILDENRGFPILYYYESIGQDEILMRFCCDYFVKDGIVFEKTSCSVEMNACIIYVLPAEEEQVVETEAVRNPHHKIRLELREFQEDTAHYPILHTFEFPEPLEALLHLQSDRLFHNGRTWVKTSTEIDEDRKAYVYYAQPEATPTEQE
ncbi:MAG TPA: hypothetical protein VFV52_16790 [Bacilli bacterium]|nr:hypothetical protein [Bacilli bacterium]